jgi:hypothetical protein
MRQETRVEAEIKLAQLLFVGSREQAVRPLHSVLRIGDEVFMVILKHKQK